MRVEVYKNTTSSWYPEYTLNNKDKLVRVSFIKLRDNSWRVCAWGDDDFGLEKDFLRTQEKEAWCLFLEVIGLDDVTHQALTERGFYGA